MAFIASKTWQHQQVSKASFMEGPKVNMWFIISKCGDRDRAKLSVSHLHQALTCCDIIQADSCSMDTVLQCHLTAVYVIQHNTTSTRKYWRHESVYKYTLAKKLLYQCRPACCGSWLRCHHKRHALYFLHRSNNVYFPQACHESVLWIPLVC